jgi:hypothetical protein
MVGIKDCDDQDGAQIVDDGERRQEDFQGKRHATAERGQDAQRKGDVGGGRDRPAAQRHRVAPVEGDVEGGRHGHAADGAGDRQRHLRGLRQRTLHDLALDLQANQQEEERHQAVVDPQQQRLVEIDELPGEAKPDVEQALDRAGERRIGEHQRQQRRHQERQRRGGFAVDEILQPVRPHVIPGQQNARVFRPGRPVEIQIRTSRGSVP